MTEQNFFNKVSFIARLGSGSASRSISGPLMIWGENEFHSGCSNFFAVKYDKNIHQSFKNYQNTILIIDDKIKTLSSSEGHKKMTDHPFLNDRKNQAKKNLEKFIPLQRVGKPEDISNACMYLLSDQASYITGIEMIVDGGITSKP